MHSDLFVTPVPRPAPPTAWIDPRKPSMTCASDDIEHAVRLLEDSGSYRVLRRLEERPVRRDLGSTSSDGRHIGIILDTETTGLDRCTDEIIEIGMVRFSYDDSGIVDVLAEFEGLQQPGRSLTPEISRLTGLTDALLAGHRFDPEEVQAFSSGADLVIAHNARFDRPFMEGNFPCFRDKPWTCSMAEVPWRDLGAEGTKLGYLLQAFGTFHTGHRALSDCRALLEILASPPPAGGTPAFQHLLRASRRVTTEIRAVGAPFHAKDLLKGRNYRWSAGDAGRPKAWWTEVPEEQVAEELTFLRERVYCREVVVPMVRLDATTRFRA